MKLVGIMPVRNEAWCIGLTARAALLWCDELIVYLHACADSSAAIVRDIAIESGNIVSVQNPMEIWDEMAHRQAMLNYARACGATHVAIVDADEILTGNLLPDSPSALASQPSRSQILTLPLYNLRGSLTRYHADGLWGNRIVSVAFEDSPDLYWRGDRFHHREPMGRRLTPWSPVKQGEGGIMHLWGASERRLIAKHALYKITERLRFPDKRIEEINFTYSMFRTGSPRENAAAWRFSETPESWWKPYEHLMRHLDLDAEPWQEQAVRDAVALHGHAQFAGLDLFGIA